MSKRSAFATWVPTLVLGAVLFWFWDSTWMWPLKVLVVLFHELGHAVATWLTGGEVVEIGLAPNQGGHTLSRGGVRFIVLNAGYLGSLIAGAGLLGLSRRAKVARASLLALGIALFVVGLWFVRPIASFGLGFTLVMSALLAALSRIAPAEVCAAILRGLGVFSIMYAVFDIRDDVFRAPGSARTDATMLAELTGVPAPIWGILWITVGLLLLYALRGWLVGVKKA